MKLVRFESLHGQQDVDCPDLGEYRKWKQGEEKQLPDDLAEIALTNSNFIDVDAEEKQPEAPPSDTVEEEAPPETESEQTETVPEKE